MSDHMKKAQSGDPLVVPAQAYNAFIDAARDFQQRTAQIGQQATPQARQSGIVRVRNASGADRGRFDVLGVNGPIIDPSANLDAFRNDVALECVTPTADHAGRFVILAEPIAAGAIGRACIESALAARVVGNIRCGCIEADQDVTGIYCQKRRFSYRKTSGCNVRIDSSKSTSATI